MHKQTKPSVSHNLLAMKTLKKKIGMFHLLLFVPFLLHAQSVKVVTNQVGYESTKAKHAVIVAGSKIPISAFQLIDAETHHVVYTGKPVYSGPVSKWKTWL